jgi:AraC-like DNA-binding protein
MQPLEIKHIEFEAPLLLQDTIKCFWYSQIEFGTETSGFEVVPDGYAEITFYFGSSCSILTQSRLEPLSSPFVVGLLNKPVQFFAKDRFEVIGIRCYPWTVFSLLGLTSNKKGINTFTHPLAQLQQPIEEHLKLGNINKAIALLSQYLLKIRPITPDITIQKAGAALQNTKGTLTVGGIADAAHTTVRTLERKFRESTGHTVKDVSALLRFEQARNQLWLNPNTHLAALAHDLGYTDQPHLSREFKKYSGTTPAAFARKANKDRQFITRDFVAFVQS